MSLGKEYSGHTFAAYQTSSVAPKEHMLDLCFVEDIGNSVRNNIQVLKLK